jgi:hypothetical protein
MEFSFRFVSSYELPTAAAGFSKWIVAQYYRFQTYIRGVAEKDLLKERGKNKEHQPVKLVKSNRSSRRELAPTRPNAGWRRLRIGSTVRLRCTAPHPYVDQVIQLHACIQYLTQVLQMYASAYPSLFLNDQRAYSPCFASISPSSS